MTHLLLNHSIGNDLIKLFSCNVIEFFKAPLKSAALLPGISAGETGKSYGVSGTGELRGLVIPGGETVDDSSKSRDQHRESSWMVP